MRRPPIPISDPLQTWAKRTGSDGGLLERQQTLAHGLPQSGDDNRLVAAIGYMPHTKSRRDASDVPPTSTIGCV